MRTRRREFGNSGLSGRGGRWAGAVGPEGTFFSVFEWVDCEG